MVWSEVREEMGARLRSWYDAPDAHHKQLALAAMLATGSDDFKDIVVPLLTDPRDQVRLAVYHSGSEFLLSSLGPRWVDVVQSWTEEARLNLILQLAHDPWLADTVEQLALADPSSRIKWNAARQLSWYGFTEKVEKTARPFSMTRIFGPRYVRCTRKRFRYRSGRAQSEATHVKNYTQEAANPIERLQVLRFLQRVGGKQIAERIKAELDALDEEQLKREDEGGTTWALEELGN